MGFCSGFDIAGLHEGDNVCPHKPGACLVDEEFFLGTCYKKCSLLTENIYPYRVAAATCCKVYDGTCVVDEGVVGGLGLNGKSLTRDAFNVGGGCGDGSKVTDCKSHLPHVALTEVQLK